ncbi:hypothetical protein KI688_012074 [Linnemannia hyalina]|uniref:Uncharacterized protein n=1 Tax=Linnemannia hyalina TaxID=64524 RepID=A0A9P7XX16_9FUNG|nr:hypothetical protein KI688_012074 [Linnemannia hyalina]
MRSEKVILLRHLVALLTVSSASSWIQSAHGLKFSPINEIILGTEVTIDWTGQPSLGNVEQSVVLMKDGNALLTLCQGQITGSGQCSFDLKEEHQVLGDGYQLAMVGMDGVALDYSPKFSIKAGNVEVEPSSGGGEDEDEYGIEAVKDKDDGEEQGDGDDDDAKVEKKRTGHGDDGDDGGAKKKKDKKKGRGYQKSQVHKQSAKDNKQQQQHHHNNEQQQNKKQPKQHKQKKQQQQKDGYYKHQVDKLVKTFQQQQKEQHQNRFTVMSTGSREQRAKEAAQLLEKNRHRRQMLLVAKRHQYLRMRQLAVGLQASINSIFDQLAPPMAHAAEPSRAQVVVSASDDADESNKDSNVGIGINPILGNDAHVELMPERPIQKAATGAVAGGTDEIDMELADALEHHPDKKDKKEKEKKAEQADAKKEKDAKAETKDKAEQGTWGKIFGGIATFGKNVGAIVADGFTKVQHVVVGGGAATPEGEL